jgi:hypothetical protein
MRAVLAGERLARPHPDTPEDLVELIRDCTQLNVTQRPSMGRVQEQLSSAPLLFVPGPAADACTDSTRVPLSLTLESDKESEEPQMDESTL